jgi:predicted pyridoxine 5'-phosphate oxidase superfamily flavin-nucleotide-binding protein
MTPAAPGWHAGERALQDRAGVAARMADVGARVLRPFMPEQHRAFFAELPFLVAGALDADGQPWAAVLAGPPGFVHSTSPTLLRVDAQPLPHDPLQERLVVGSPIGLLGIQPHTRRRNRMNGKVHQRDARGFTVAVGQSFGNCPKYIQPREAVFRPGAAEAVVHAGLDAPARRIVGEADTFFIATAHPEALHAADPAQGVDVSHRGGPPGFVHVAPDGTLRVPDYVGNTFFNTFGNLLLEPRCGLLFLEPRTGERLYLAATATVEWEGTAQRTLVLAPQRVLRVTGGLPLAWNEVARL